jgi:HAD superfamily hydrolase (TIGR01509 family)
VIRAVTVDFWNTIADSSNGEARRNYRDAALAEALDVAGRAWDETAIRDAIRSAAEAFETRWFGERRTMSADESLRHVWRTLDVRVPADAHARTVRAFEESILVGPPALLPGCAAALRDLAARHRLAVISDTAFSPGAMLRGVLEHHGILDAFAALVFSDEVGVSKPHPRIFARALAALGAAPAESVHVGDIERTDVAGAKDAGMYAILFRGDVARPRYREDSPTRADATAVAWDDVPGIVARLGRDGA